MSAAHIKLALSLPPRLRTFFARYPPRSILPSADLTTFVKNTRTAYQKEALNQNPFSFKYHKATGRWHDPKYSLRRQAELAKLAREHGVEELLPYSKKRSDVRLEKRVAQGLRVKGTGVGQKVKGHKHERHMIAKYVFSLVGRWWVCEEFWERGANSWGQDGEEEKGHAGDAGSHQGMEKGRAPPCSCPCERLGWSGTDRKHRSESGTGQSGPRARSRVECRQGSCCGCHVFRMYNQQIYNLTTTHRLPPSKTLCFLECHCPGKMLRPESHVTFMSYEAASGVKVLEYSSQALTLVDDISAS